MARKRKDKRVKYPLTIKSLNVGDHYAVTCLKIDADKYVKRLRSNAQMAKKRHSLIASYKVYKVVGAVILERTK